MPRTPLRMPKMSMTMETGELLAWRIAPGQQVSEGDPVCDVMTDKVDMEVESPADGVVVELAAAEGDVVAVGTPIAWLETASAGLMDDLLGSGPADAESDAEADADAEPVAAPAGSPEPASPEAAAAAAGPAPEAGILPAIPRARQLAAAAGLPLSSVRGTGPGGAVLTSDVQAALDAAAASAAPPVPAPSVPAPSVPAPPVPAPPVPAPPAPAAPPLPAAPPIPAPAAPPAALLPAASGAVAAPLPDAWPGLPATLHPRPDDATAPGLTVWADVVLPNGPADQRAFRARLVAALGAALAGSGPDRTRHMPRIGLVLSSPAGPVTATVSSPHLADPDQLRALLDAAEQQALGGLLDVRLLAPADLTVTSLPQVDRVAVPLGRGQLVSVGVGSVAPRAVAAGDGIAVRSTVTISATADPVHVDPATLAAVLGSATAALSGSPRVTPTLL